MRFLYEDTCAAVDQRGAMFQGGCLADAIAACWDLLGEDLQGVVVVACM